MLAKLGRSYQSAVKRLTLSAAYIAGFGVIYMTIGITMDVFLRFFFNTPTIWVDELSNYTLLMMSFLGLAWALSEKSHIRIDIVVNRLPRIVQDWLRVISSVAFLIFTGLLFYFTFEFFWRTLIRGTTSRTLWDIPLAPWQAFIPLGLLIIVLLLLVNLYNEVKIARQKVKEAPAEPIVSEIL